MEYEPVAKRTRSGKAVVSERIKEMTKKAKIAAKTEYIKKKKALQIPLHSLEEEQEKDEDDDVVEVLDKDEFERLHKLKMNSQNQDVGFEEISNVGQIVVNHDVNHGYDDHDHDDDVGQIGENSNMGFEEKLTELMDDGVNGDGGDSSEVEILGDGYDLDNYNDLDDVDLDLDDDDDDDDVGVCSSSYQAEKKVEKPIEKVGMDSEEDSESDSSTEDDIDDRDFKVDEPETSISSSDQTESSDDSEEETQIEVDDDHDVRKRLKEEREDGGSKSRRGRKRKDSNSDFRVFEGIPISSHPVQNSTPQLKAIGNRTRSHWKKPKLPKKDGSFSKPVNVEYISSTDAEYSDSSEEEEEGNGPVNPTLHPNRNQNPNPNPNPGPGDNGVKKKKGRPPKSKKEELSPPSKKRKRVKGFKNNELQRIIINSMSENGETNLEEFMSNVGEVYLQLKFKFGVEEVVPKEKTEQELQEEKLWKEMDFAVGACNIGLDYTCGDNNNKNNNEDFVPSDNAVEQAKLCQQGKHYLLLDDEIGLRCKFCSFVEIESKYLTPDFNENPFGQRDNRSYGRFLYNDDIPSADRFRFHDKGFDSQAGPTGGTYGTVWDLIPGTKERLYAHQQEGFEFIWNNVAGGITISDLGKPTKSGLGGCIICHAPGTGKTRLAIVFLQSYLKQYPTSRPVIIAPSSVLLTWEEEFARWKTGTPFLNMNKSDLSGEEDPKLLSIVRNEKDVKTVRLVKLYTWVYGKGVLGISYTLFEKLTGEKKGGGDDEIRDILLKKCGVLVLDEGHTPRNENSLIWKALSNVSTRKKIILSGTPFQNNFQELYNTITLAREEFVDPLLADSHRDYRGKHGRKHGYCSSDYGKRSFHGSMLSGVDESRRIEELKLRIKPFVHVYKGGILKEKLCGLIDSVLVLKPSDLQKRCFQHLKKCPNSLELDYSVSITSVHPSILLRCENVPVFLDEEMKGLLREHETDLDAGVKTRFLFELIKLSKGEKVLVFSQYINPLEFLGGLLKKHFNWTVGTEFLYIDGKQETKARQNFIRVFNDPRSEARVLLASTKACCEGIHLVGASRVVLLDVVWNPSVERQAISRAYRLGQTKNVHVYHLITWDTQEWKKYFRKESKDRVSELVFSPSERESDDMQKINANAKSSVSEDRILDEMISHEKTKPIFKKIIYQPKADDLIENFG